MGREKLSVEEKIERRRVCQRAYREKNKDKIYESQTKYRKANLDKFTAYTKKYRDERRSELKAKGCINLTKALQYKESPKFSGEER